MEFVKWRLVFRERLNQPTTEHHYYARIIFAIRSFQAAFSKKARRPKYSDCLVKYKTKSKETKPEIIEDEFAIAEKKEKVSEASRSRWAAFFSSMTTGKKEEPK